MGKKLIREGFWKKHEKSKKNRLKNERFWESKTCQNHVRVIVFMVFSDLEKIENSMPKWLQKVIVVAERYRRTPRTPGRWKHEVRKQRYRLTSAMYAKTVSKSIKNPSKMEPKSIQNRWKIEAACWRRPGIVLGGSPANSRIVFGAYFAKKWDLGRHFGPQWILEGSQNHSF